MTTGTPSEFSTTLRLAMRTLASEPASTEDCSAPRWAAPPMWKVRMVSWVPGSPIDCAAMTPTASPPLVVAYAIKGTVTEDFTTTTIGQDQDGKIGRAHV